MDEFYLRNYAKKKLGGLYDFDERIDADVVSKAETPNKLDTFDECLSELEDELDLVLPLDASMTGYKEASNVFRVGIRLKLLEAKANEWAENIDMGQDKFRQQFQNITELMRIATAQLDRAKMEYENVVYGFGEIVVKTGYEYDPITGEDTTDYDGN